MNAVSTDPAGLAQKAASHLRALLCASVAPELPADLAEIPGMGELHAMITDLRAIVARFARGDLAEEIQLRGFMAGSLKALQAHLRHLTWQVRQVELGDFSQRVDFLGEFSLAFNNMIQQLDTTLTSLREKEKTLLRLTRTLQREVELRSSAVLALRQSESRFKYLAEHDPLTDTLNRRSFLALVPGELEAAAANGMPCCIALLDVDHFKRFNDTHGHLAGDEALRHLVKIATSGLRHVDFMGRYGGEEFIFFFAGADLAQGIRAADRIRRTVENSPVELPGGPVPLACSLGLCVVLPEWPGARNDFYLQAAINAADQALYQAKREGRNRVVAAPVAPLVPAVSLGDEEPEEAVPAGESALLHDPAYNPLSNLFGGPTDNPADTSPDSPADDSPNKPTA